MDIRAPSRQVQGHRPGLAQVRQRRLAAADPSGSISSLTLTPVSSGSSPSSRRISSLNARLTIIPDACTTAPEGQPQPAKGSISHRRRQAGESRVIAGLVCLAGCATSGMPTDGAAGRRAVVSGGCLDTRGAPHRATSERRDSFDVQLVRDRLEGHTSGPHRRDPIPQFRVVGHPGRSLAPCGTHTSPGALHQPLALPLGTMA